MASGLRTISWNTALAIPAHRRKTGTSHSRSHRRSKSAGSPNSTMMLVARSRARCATHSND
ncbi:MAG: hypothetical protein EBZ54_02645 [Actinobacteria bacterium]|nr:hypothetical protein [Actinomycetota bacterium]